MRPQQGVDGLEDPVALFGEVGTVRDLSGDIEIEVVAAVPAPRDARGPE
ncbi:hypothetical protein [Streptomyces sp. NBC_01483]|nr:hypothetical protein [Streptomyces sp. NBC_01483]